MPSHAARLGKNAVSTFLDNLLFAAVCVACWAIFPLLIAAGALALFAYAVIAELTASSKRRIAEDETAARRAGQGLPGAL